MTKRIGDDIVVVLIYVDDLLVTGRNNHMIEEAKQILQDNFKIKDPGDLRLFLGIEIARISKRI